MVSKSRSANGASVRSFGAGFFAGLFDYCERVFAQEWCSAGEQIEQNGADTVDVGRRCEILGRSVRLLRSDVTRRSENRQRPREIAGGVEPFGQTEIAHQRFAAAVEQNVSGL